MSDIIHLLPDSIANQIAAGEVIQRPSSVVKELVENAIDAGADSIQLIIKDAGRTLIQVIDNGKGMSATDARMAFERHATSKIRKADDLFDLHTMGFRGEALPSIAAISHVEVKTRRAEDELGTLLQIAGSRVESQEPVACPVGSNFSVKNIFYNVPARRKFLKSNDTERRNILTELERIVLVNPSIEFTFIDNDVEVLKFPAGGLRQRIVNVVGKNFNQQLISIDIDTSLAKITGFIGKPESARKARAQQFFFVNNRYMRHAYFNKAVQSAFDPLILNGDFDTEGAIDIPIHDPSKNISQPRVNVDPSYNPFKSPARTNYQRPKFDLDQLYKGFESDKNTVDFSTEVAPDVDIFSQQQTGDSEKIVPEMVVHYQYKNRYILTSVKSGLMLIDQHRAHIRILFDQFLSQIEHKRGISQRALFPEIIELSPSEAAMMPYLTDDLEAVGFDLGHLGNNSYAINGTPAEITNIDSVQLVHNMINKSIESGSDVKEEIREALALSMAYAASIPYGHTLSTEEMNKIVDQLFASSAYKHTPDGKTIISMLEDDAIEKMFK